MTIRAAHNSGLAKGGLTCFLETFVLRMNVNAENPTLRQAANRAAHAGCKTIRKERYSIWMALRIAYIKKAYTCGRTDSEN